MEGVSNQVSIGVESTFGTAVTPTVSLPIKESDGVQPAQDVRGLEAINTNPAKNKRFIEGKLVYEGGYEMDAYPESLGYLLKSAFGGVSSALASGESAVYEHTFTESVTKASLTVEQMVGDIVKRFAGFVVTSIKFSVKAGEEAVIAVEGFAKSDADASVITATYESNRPFTFEDVQTLSIGGTDIKAKVEELEWEYTNGAELFHGLGSKEAQAKYSTQSEFKGKIKAYVDSVTAQYFDDHVDGTEQALIINIDGDSIGTAEKLGLLVQADKCAFTSFESKLSFDYNAVEVEFEAREDASTGLVKAVLTNEVASY